MTEKTKVYLDDELIQELKNRLSRIEGHVHAVAEMLERKESCNDLLLQLSAVKSALNQVTIRLLQGHLDTCVEQCLREGDERELKKLKQALALTLKRN